MLNRCIIKKGTFASIVNLEKIIAIGKGLIINVIIMYIQLILWFHSALQVSTIKISLYSRERFVKCFFENPSLPACWGR